MRANLRRTMMSPVSETTLLTLPARATSLPTSLPPTASLLSTMALNRTLVETSNPT